MRSYCLNGRGESGQIIRAGDENIHYAAVFQAVQNGCPEFGAFVLSNPHSRYLRLKRFLFLARKAFALRDSVFVLVSPHTDPSAIAFLPDVSVIQ